MITGTQRRQTSTKNEKEKVQEKAPGKIGTFSENAGKVVGKVAKSLSWGFRELGVKRGIINAKKGICKITGTDHKKVDQAMYGTTAVVGTVYGVTSAAAAATTGLAVAGVSGVSYVVGKQIAPDATDATAEIVGTAFMGSMQSMRGFSKGFSEVIYDGDGNEVVNNSKKPNGKDENQADFDPFEKNSKNTSSTGNHIYKANFDMKDGSGIEPEKFTPCEDAEFDDPFEHDTRFNENPFELKPKKLEKAETFDDPFADDPRFNEEKTSEKKQSLEGYEIFDYQPQKDEVFGIQPQEKSNDSFDHFSPKQKKSDDFMNPFNTDVSGDSFGKTLKKVTERVKLDSFGFEEHFSMSSKDRSSTFSSSSAAANSYPVESGPKPNASPPNLLPNFNYSNSNQSIQTQKVVKFPPPLPAANINNDDIWDLFS